MYVVQPYVRWCLPHLAFLKKTFVFHYCSTKCTKLHQIWWKYCDFDPHLQRQKCRSDLDHLEFQKLLPVNYYFTIHHQIWWTYCDFHLEHRHRKCKRDYYSRWRLPPSWISKLLATSLLFDIGLSLPNLA